MDSLPFNGVPVSRSAFLQLGAATPLPRSAVLAGTRGRNLRDAFSQLLLCGTTQQQPEVTTPSPGAERQSRDGLREWKLAVPASTAR